MSVHTFIPQPISLTEAALSRIQSLSDYSKSNNRGHFRVYIEGGGCSGFSYRFKFDSEALPEDTCINQDNITILVDPLSIQYLAGAEIDYKEDLQGKQFFINNPNATATCGCGNSFSI